jgi:hypothetical protein
MNTTKSAWHLFALIAALALIALPLAGCGGDNDNNTTQTETATLHSETITGLLSGNYSAVVEGNLTDTDWVGVADKVKNALNSNYNSLDPNSGIANTFRVVFGDGDGVTIAVEKNPEYNKYRTTRGITGTIYINFAILDDIDTLGSALRDATRVMGGAPSTPEVVHAMIVAITFC